MEINSLELEEDIIQVQYLLVVDTVICFGGILGYCYSEKLSAWSYISNVFSGPGPEVLWTWYNEKTDKWFDSGTEGILGNKADMVNKLPELRKSI